MNNEENDKINDNNSVKDDPFRMIIKAREQIYTFEREPYKNSLFDGFIDEVTYKEIIEKAGKKMGESWAKKRENDQIKIPRKVIIFSVIAVLLTIAYMVTLYTSTTAEDGTALFVISIICISAASTIVVVLSIYNFCRKIGKFKSLDMIISENLGEYFGELNAMYRNSSGSLEFKYNEVAKQIEITRKR